ncbi:MAG: DUF1028 domain-containing protein [Candidatus Fermentibacteraceae bacterium]
MIALLLALLSTFSIVANDPETGEWGIAVASKVPFVGQMVPWAKAGAGAIATQAWANLGYGPEGLRLLSEGMSAEEVIQTLTSGDSLADQRQIGVVDSRGNPASFTGTETMFWAGGVTGQGYAIQGNILTGPEVVEAMERSFLATDGEILAYRLLEALKAGEDAGGDSRGRQSAAILVVRENGGHQGSTDLLVDIQVSDNPEAVTELRRLYFRWWEPLNMLELYQGEKADAILSRMASQDYGEAWMKNAVAWSMAMADLELDRALEIALEASASEPEDANIMDTVAEILFRLDRIDEAVQWGSRALESDPDNTYLQGQLDRFRGNAAGSPEPGH